jgi:8-oxo-dGTP pyrophosphatase MutT (NUDIX family)
MAIVALATESEKAAGRQVAALCWRIGRDSQLEILLITSLRTRRWILPKGWPMTGVSPARAAAREALEEAGVTGDIAPEAIGHYASFKQRKSGQTTQVQVDVFALRVTLQHQTWPEKGDRDVAWMTPQAAAQKISEPELRRILLDFRENHSV